METNVLSYRIIIEPEKEAKTGKKVFNAYCPSLGVADWGKTIEEAIANIQEAIECHLESLIKHHQPITNTDTAEFVVANTQVTLPKGFKPAFI